MTDLNTLMNILETKTEKNALIRAGKLRLLPSCNRCLGSGRYSFNMVNGSTCFGCSGSGSREPKTAAEWECTLANASLAVADGRLASYLEGIEAMKRAKNAYEKVSAAWKDIGFDYSWQNAGSFRREPTEENKRHFEISEINAKCYNALQLIGFDTPKTTEGWIRLDLLQAHALAIIAAAKTEYAIYLLDNPKQG